MHERAQWPHGLLHVQAGAWCGGGQAGAHARRPQAAAQARLKCGDPQCGKPRCLYKATPLDDEQNDLVEQLDELQTMFTCGAPLTMEGHGLHGNLVTRT